MGKNRLSWELWPSCNRKVRMYSTQRNSLGGMPGPPECGGTCPGCTSGPGGCWTHAKATGQSRVCYADKLAKAWSTVRTLLQHNTAVLKGSRHWLRKFQRFDFLFRMFGEECDRYAKLHPGARVRDFRLYWSGDIADLATAKALKAALARHPDIGFWTYTRTFGVVRTLAGIPNLRLFVSLDPVNCRAGMRRFGRLEKAGKLSFAYMGTENRYGFVPCPVDSGRRKLDGACGRCRLCLVTKKPVNIWFKTK